MFNKLFKRNRFLWGFEFEIFSKDQNGVLTSIGIIQNTITNEGEQLMGQVFLKAASLTSFYLGLANDSPLKADVLADIENEPVGFGYSRAEIERSVVGWPTEELDSGDYRWKSKMVTFAASGGPIGPFNILFLTDAASGTSGKFIDWAVLAEPTTIGLNESWSIKVSFKLKPI